MSSSREPLRLVRGGVAATVATALALIGHVAGGGAMPGWLGIALPRLSAAILGSQALFHGLFMAGTPGDPGTRLVAPPGTHLGHGSHGDHGGPGAQGAQGLPATEVGSHAGHAGHGSDGVGAIAGHALHGNHSDLEMLLWHMIAAVG